MECPEPRYACTDYVTRAYLTEVPDENFSNIIQLNVAKRVQGGGGGCTIHNRSDKYSGNLPMKPLN